MTRITLDYIIEGSPTLVEGTFSYKKEKEKFYFRGLSDGRWTLDVGKEAFAEIGEWNSSGYWMDSETAHAILVDCAHQWGMTKEMDDEGV